jgi:hypothetical protein
MTTNQSLINEAALNLNQSIFLLCDHCLWTATCLDKLHIRQILGTNSLCPVCKYEQLSSFPITANESFTYRKSHARGLEIIFGIRSYSALSK